jgi:hypothetical protein
MNLAIYRIVSSYEEAKREMARIRERAEEVGAEIITLVPSGPFGQHEGEEAILKEIAATGNDPTTCVKGLISKPLNPYQ